MVLSGRYDTYTSMCAWLYYNGNAYTFLLACVTYKTYVPYGQHVTPVGTTRSACSEMSQDCGEGDERTRRRYKRQPIARPRSQQGTCIYIYHCVQSTIIQRNDKTHTKIMPTGRASNVMIWSTDRCSLSMNRPGIKWNFVCEDLIILQVIPIYPFYLRILWFPHSKWDIKCQVSSCTPFTRCHSRSQNYMYVWYNSQ